MHFSTATSEKLRLLVLVLTDIAISGLDTMPLASVLDEVFAHLDTSRASKLLDQVVHTSNFSSRFQASLWAQRTRPRLPSAVFRLLLISQ